MRHSFLLSVTLLTCFLSGCYFKYGASPFEGMPICRSETTVAVYDKNGTFSVPGCVDYEVVSNNEYDAYLETMEAEGSFPYVENNKYYKNQVVMENLNTRVLAFCRGTQEEIEDCVARLEESCYTRITDIPYLPAKYDFLKRGTYPTRRWRNGENVPRW